MAKLKYQDRTIATREDENVLDALLRHGINVPFSCRSGVCHICLQRGIQGAIPQVAQRGLSAELHEQGYFMACKCIPQEDMEIAPPTGLFRKTMVHSKKMLSPHVCKLLIDPPFAFSYRTGQFINLRRPDGLVRSYSLASLPTEDYFLEVHVQRKDGGSMSNWILDELKDDAELEIQGADGECYYRDDTHGQPMLLVATGTGLAPLFGIVRDALQRQHQAPIHLYHGGRDTDRFYLREQLRQLEQQHANFHYHECISGNPAPPDGAHAGRAHEVAFAQHQDLRGWQVYLAGLAEMVDSGEQLALKHGALPAAIHTDAFALRDLRKTRRDNTPAIEEEAKYPPADAALWAALRDGELLMAVLKDFYGRVFSDERMSSFFHGVTMQRSIEKQYLFMRQILTGEKIYFGERPRNAHHWMVISDELFDYRSNIMLACLREHGLPEPMVQRFRAIEEFYRKDIVKPAPVPRLMGDIELPLDGFDELVLDSGTLCDTCEREVAAGEKVLYHVRIGKVYCSDCNTQHHHEVPQD